MDNQLIFGHDRLIAEWVADQIKFGASVHDDSTAIGVINNQGDILAGVVYYMHSEVDVRMAVAALPKVQWVTRQTLKVFFGHVFYDPPLGMSKRRATTVVHKKNKHARQFNESAGFKLEGVHPEAFPDGGTAISYGLLKRNCKWI